MRGVNDCQTCGQYGGGQRVTLDLWQRCKVPKASSGRMQQVKYLCLDCTAAGELLRVDGAHASFSLHPDPRP